VVRAAGAKHDDRSITVAWALNHALEHVALHAGNMQITRHWWEQMQL